MSIRVFIGSSQEGRELAGAVQEALASTFDCTVWDQDVFHLGDSTLESLADATEEFDFAVLCATPDDIRESRGKSTATPRDNVVLELGLFIGHLGRSRAVLLHQNKGVELPSDLLGIKTARFKPHEDGNLLASVGAATNELRRHFNRVGPRLRPREKKPRRVALVLERGSTRDLEKAADAALYVGERRYDFGADLRRYATSGDPIPSKYLYWTREGSRHWIELCEMDEYGYYQASTRNLLRVRSDLVGVICEAVGEPEIDYVSLGSGDGTKDVDLLSAFVNQTSEGEIVYYYPVDISDPLMVEAIRNTNVESLPSTRFNLKGIISDYLRLPSLAYIYEERPNKNVFSVLGNTLGNSDETRIMECLKSSLRPGDVVLLEVNVGDATSTMSVSKLPVYRQHDFTPLSSLGVEYSDAQLRYKIEERKSVVPGTKTVSAYYGKAIIGNSTVSNVCLNQVHHYQFEPFKKAICQRLRVRELWSDERGDIGVLVAQRQETSGRARA